MRLVAGRAATSSSPLLRVGESERAQLDPAGELLAWPALQQCAEQGVAPAKGSRRVDAHAPGCAPHAQALRQALSVIAPEQQLLAVGGRRSCQVAEGALAAEAEVALTSAEAAPAVHALTAAARAMEAEGEACRAELLEQVHELGRGQAGRRARVHAAHYCAQNRAAP